MSITVGGQAGVRISNGVVVGPSVGVRLAGGLWFWNTTGDSTDSTILADQDSLVAVNDGSSYLYFGKISTTWKTLWTDRNGALLRGDTAGTDLVTVASNGPSPFDTAYEFATDRLAGAVSAGATFAHEADCVIEWTQTTLPSALATTAYFRQQDANNLWYVWINSTGDLRLYEKVAGVDTLRAGTGGVVANGNRVVVIADGTTIRAYSNNVLRFTYSSASNFATATGGVLFVLGTGSAVSDIVSFPRTLSGAAANALDRAVA